MRIVKGQIDYADQSIFKLFTCNSTLNKTGQLVMGCGTAYQVRLNWPELPRFFGDRLDQIIQNEIVHHTISNIGTFRVKDKYYEPAKIELIESSTQKLIEFINNNWILSDFEVHMPVPGIGAGRLPKFKVMPIIKRLPDNVIVYESD